MISFFRRALSSWLVLGLLGLILVAFVVTGISTPGALSGGAPTGEEIAKVGRETVHSAEVSQRLQLELQQARAKQPELDMARLVATGAYDQIVNQLVTGRAVEAWARKQGLVATDRMIDGDIASIPAFSGPTGSFDPGTMRALLSQQRTTEAQLRKDVASDIVRRQVLVPVAAAAYAPAGLVTPYASLLLETRSGMIGVVPARAMAGGPAPSEAEIANWYSRNVARYTLPERRVLRYAVFGRDQVAANAKPSDVEIAAAYKQDAALYAASETRTLSQLILPSEAAARAIAAKVKGGVPFATAATQAGFAVGDIALGSLTRREFARTASPAIAAAAYAMPTGGTTDSIKSELGWHIVHVDAVKATPARSLDAVRAEIADRLEKKKIDDALTTLVTRIEDGIADGATFDEVVAQQRLSAITTPALLPNGLAPDQPTWRPAPELAPLLKTAFEASPDDDPTVETVGADQRYALIHVAQVTPSAPVPLAKARAAVIADLLTRRALDRARAVASAIVAKANAGTPLAAAIAQAGVPLPAPQPASARQIDIARSGQPAPPPLARLFSMIAGKTELLPVADDQGFFVVQLNGIVRGDATTLPALVDATRREFANSLAEEYVSQFANAAQKAVGVRRNDAAIARLRTQAVSGQ
jgi:peptidyl-prolyl cis-trans isomerase D